MINCKKEFTNHVSKLRPKVVCAIVEIKDTYWRLTTKPKVIILPMCYTEAEYDQFLKDLDFEYDAGYGGQNLYGTIWYSDESWSVRGEYDGSEWWEHMTKPEVPSEITSISNGRLSNET